MSQARNGLFGSLSNCFNRAKNIIFSKVTAGTVLVTSVLVLDFVCDQKTQHENINWKYYSDAPSRIVWLLLSSLMQGINLVIITDALRQESVINANRISAQKVLAGSILYSTSMAFANFSLTATQPIINEKWGYISLRACINGSLGGAVMSGGNYMLNKLNFSIRPLTRDHCKFVSAGIFIAMMQILLNFVCDQMIKQGSIKWDSLTSPVKPFAWQVIVLATTGAMYGIAKVGFDRYGNPEDGSMKNFNRILLPTMAIFGYAGSFLESSLTVPIKKENAGYITAKSFSAIPSSILGVAIFSITMGLFKQRQLTSLSRMPLLVNEQNDEEKDFGRTMMMSRL